MTATEPEDELSVNDPKKVRSGRIDYWADRSRVQPTIVKLNADVSELVCGKMFVRQNSDFQRG